VYSVSLNPWSHIDIIMRRVKIVNETAVVASLFV